ncbi:sulfotransferase family protein [Roseobacter weihaiensis]|uniref:sulfotransferase family protein n=1 Tax=Roseobacter weihaiensis TaxID=2763262 RepID=UPI001D0AB4BD|nr:sulfotransferase family protein [Roseobacter sp. H9]
MQKLLQKVLYDTLGYIPTQRPFVFGIGLSKTGTTSLNEALNILGFRAEHLPPATRVAPAGKIVLDWPWWLSKCDAATDLSVAAVFEELRALFPRARFIYTPRDLDKWLDSCRRHFTHDLAARRVAQKNFHLMELSQAFYGSFLYDEALYRAAYLRHDTAVRAAFAGDPAFLEYNLTENPDWVPLCDFLERPVPQAPFPNANKGRTDI